MHAVHGVNAPALSGLVTLDMRDYRTAPKVLGKYRCPTRAPDGDPSTASPMDEAQAAELSDRSGCADRRERCAPSSKDARVSSACGLACADGGASPLSTAASAHPAVAVVPASHLSSAAERGHSVAARGSCYCNLFRRLRAS
jgi:hypothetical protein